MSNAEAVLPSNALLSGQPYYPLMLSSSSGTGVSGTDAELSYEDGTLSVPKINIKELITRPIFPRISLTPTWVSYGDSFTAGGAWSPVWATRLASLTSTNLINKASGGTTSDYASLNNALAQDMLFNPAYANYSSVVAYGFNDSFNNKSLYDSYYFWTQNIMTLALGLSLPQNKIQNIRDASWIKSGVWTNTPNYSTFSMFTKVLDAYVEKNIGTARYIAIRHTAINNNTTHWEVTINGELMNTFQRTDTLIEGQTAGYTPASYVIDLGVETPNCVVRITNKDATTDSNCIDFVAGWTDADLVNARQVLFLSIPRNNSQFNSGNPVYQDFTDEKRLFMNEGLEQVSKICRAFGLPVSFYRWNELFCIYDWGHPTKQQSDAWAREILANAIV